jgi:Fusaric acid resistance protein-like
MASAFFTCGILSAFLRLGGAYRFAAITLSVVLLIAHTRPPWVVATHRFVEVFLGIAVAQLVTALWRLPV